MKKRLLSLILALLMLGSLFPAAALAEGEIVMDPALWEPDAVQGPPVEGPEEDEAPAPEPEQPAPETQPIPVESAEVPVEEEIPETPENAGEPELPVPTEEETAPAAPIEEVAGEAETPLPEEAEALTMEEAVPAPETQPIPVESAEVPVEEEIPETPENAGAPELPIPTEEETAPAAPIEEEASEAETPIPEEAEAPIMEEAVPAPETQTAPEGPEAGTETDEAENAVVDTTPPTVTDISLSSSSVTAPGQITVTARISDDISGVGYCFVLFHNTETDSNLNCTFRLNSNGMYTGTIQIGEYTNNGPYVIQSVYLSDKAGNYEDYYGEGSPSYGNSSTSKLPDSLAALSFTVVNPNPIDTAPPTVTDISLSSSSVTAPGQITVTARISDDISGVNSCFVSFRDTETDSDLYCSLSTNSNGIHTGTIQVDEHTNSGTYVIEYVSLSDKAGNHEYYYGEGSPSYANSSTSKLPDSLASLSFAVVNQNPVDTTPPTVTDISLSPASITAPGQITVTVSTTDDISGVNSCFVSFRNTETGSILDCYPRLNSSGTFTGTIQVGEYDNSGTYVIDSVFLSDNAGNSEDYYGKGNAYYASHEPKLPDSLASLSFSVKPDTTPPTVTDISLSSSTVNASGQITVTVTASDDASGVDSCRVSFRYAEDSCLGCSLTLNSDGTFTGSVQVDEHTNSGTYVIEYVSLSDKAGNYATYYGKGSSSYASSESKLPDSLASLSMLVDTAPPMVTDISLSPSSITVSGQITVTLSASDDVSGVADCHVSFRNTNQWGPSLEYLYCYLSVNSNGTFTGTIQVDEHTNSGTYVIECVCLEDNAGNFEDYYGEGHPSYASIEPKLPASLASLSFTVSPDITPPTVTDISLSPSSVTVPGQITATVSASDDYSGVADCQQICFRNAETDSYLYCYPSLNSNGTFTGTMQVSENEKSGTYVIHSIDLGDNAWNTVCYYGKGEPTYASSEPKLPASLASLSFTVNPIFDAAPALNAANTPDGVQLTWNALSSAPRYNLYRKVGSGGWSWLAASTGTSYTDTRVASSTSYSYRIAVVSADGKTMLSPMSPEESITWFSTPTLSLTNTTSGVLLSWNAVYGAPSYSIYRKAGSGSWAWLAASTGTSYIDTSAAPGSTYSYRMAVASADGQTLFSPMSPEESITFISYVAPTLSLTNTASGVQLSWNTVYGAPRYNLYRKVGSGGWSWLAASTGTSYVDTTVVSDTSYTYRMVVVSADGKTMLSPMSPEETITWFSALTLNLTNALRGVQITWNAISGAPRYNLYRKVGSGNWTWLAASTGTSYVDTTVVSGTSYAYRMAVVTADGKTMLSPMSGEKSIRYSILASPVISSLSNVYNGVQITWSAVSGAPRYNLYRKVGSGSWSWLAASTGTSYVDSKAVSGTTCTYRLAVVTADGKSMLSPMGTEKSIRCSALAAPVISSLTNVSNGIQIKWTAVSGAPRYNIYRKVGSGSWSWLAASSGTSFVDTKVSPGTPYTYRMAVVSADGKTMLSPMGAEKSLTR